MLTTNFIEVLPIKSIHFKSIQNQKYYNLQ